MTSPFEQESKSSDITQLTNRALDQSVNKLPDKTLADLAQVRAAALEYSKIKPEQPLAKRLYHYISDHLLVNITVPVAAALVVVFSMKYVTPNTIPAMPIAMLTNEVPTEDLAMLEDLEFITWLAKNEANTVL